MASVTKDSHIWHLNDEKRELLTKERTAELLDKKGSESYESFHTLRLGGKSFGVDSAVLIAERVCHLQNLSIVDLNDIIAGRPEDEALQVLETISSALKGKNYEEINLSDNALGLKGVVFMKLFIVLSVF